MAVTYSKNNQTAGLNSDTRLNTELTAIQTALQDAVSRSGGAPNAMSADFDMGGNDILNAGTVNCSDFLIDGQPLASLADLTAQAAAAAASAAAASTSETNAAASAASINTPTLTGADAGKMLEVNGTTDGYDLVVKTSANTASTVVVRDGSARFQAADPSAAQDVATKNSSETYADAAVAAHAATPHVVELVSESITGTITKRTIFSDNTGYKYFKIVLDDVTTTGSAYLAAQVSIDGSTSETTGYEYSYTELDTAVAPIGTGATATAQTHMRLNSVAHSGSYMHMEIKVVDPHKTTKRCPFIWKCLAMTSSGAVQEEFGIAMWDTADDLTGFTLYATGGAGAISAQGTLKIYASNMPF